MKIMNRGLAIFLTTVITVTVTLNSVSVTAFAEPTDDGYEISEGEIATEAEAEAETEAETKDKSDKTDVFMFAGSEIKKTAKNAEDSDNVKECADNKEIDSEEEITDEEAYGNTYSNPVWNSDGTVTYDCVWFGDVNPVYDDKGNIVYESAKWRVLSSTKDDLFLLLDSCAYMDYVSFDDEGMTDKWRDSTIRSYLNGYNDYSDDSFKDWFFNKHEWADIKSTQVKNDSSQSYFGKDGGSDTKDKIFLLSYKEVTNREYGFNETGYVSDKARIPSDGGDWWLRSAGEPFTDGKLTAMAVSCYGCATCSLAAESRSCLRPALHISPSSIFVTPAGTVCTDGTKSEIPYVDNIYCRVVFDANGGSWDDIEWGITTTSSRVVKNEKVKKPSLNPQRPGFSFRGWYKDRACTKAWNFNNKITEDITLYAGWKKSGKDKGKTYEKDGIIYNISDSGALTITGDGEVGDLPFDKESINKAVIKKGITGLGDYCFSGCSNLGSVTIPNTVTSLGKESFAYCGLSKIIIPNSVNVIGEACFCECQSLKDVTLPKKLTAIPDGAFKNDEILTKVSIGNAVEAIGVSAFEGCKSLKTFTIGANVETIGADAFKNCDSLSVLTVNMVNIPDKLFMGSNNLTKVKMGSTVRTVGNLSFEGCENLKTVTLGSKLETIGSRAFANTGIKKISISGRVETVGQYAFSKCLNLTSASIGKCVKTIDDSAFYNCYSLKSVSLGANVEVIGDQAFANCTGLKSVTIGKKVSRIGDYAYMNDSNISTIKVNTMLLIEDSLAGVDFLNGIKPTAIIKIPKGVFEETKSVFENKSGAGDQVKYVKY